MSENNNNEELSLEEQIEKMQSALNRYKKENERFREQRDEWKSKFEAGVSNDETLSNYRQQVARSEAKLRLQQEGIKDVDRIIKRMDIGSISVDDSGAVEGLDEQLNSLKTDLPELFDSKRRVGGEADGSNRGSAPSLTPTERAVKKIFNN